MQDYTLYNVVLARNKVIRSYFPYPRLKAERASIQYNLL